MLDFSNVEWSWSSGQLLLKGHNDKVPVVFAIDLEVIEDQFPGVNGEVEALASEEVLAAVKRAAIASYANPIMRRNDQGRIVLDAIAISKSL